MAWTASVIKVEREYFQARVLVQFTDGVNSLQKEFRVSSVAQLKNLAINQIKELVLVDTLIAGTSPGSIDTTDTPPVSDPSQEQFLNTLTNVRQLLKAVDLGIIQAGNVALATAKSNLQAQFIPAYLNFL